MPKIHKNQIVGNVGEALVSYKLSKYCLVRQVSSGTDIGVDLFCESIDNGKPFLHFWIQVKTSKKRKKSFRFKIEHLRYWRKQPIPVFIFLVEEEIEKEDNSFNFEVINLAEKYIQDKDLLNTNEKKITLKSDFSITSNSGLKDFVSIQIPIIDARWKLKDGIISPIKTSKDKYEKEVYSLGSSDFQEEVLNTIRLTGFIIQEIEKQKLTDQKSEINRRQFEKILETFGQKGKWDIHFNKGISKELDGKYNEAIESYKFALKIIESDKRIDQLDENWSRHRLELRSKINRLSKMC